MISKITRFAAFASAVLLLCLRSVAAQSHDRKLEFDQFRVKLYRGHFKIPQEFHKDRDGLWVDGAGKPSSAPSVNFAGEYFLTAHSCGTCCRYYTLNDLRTGSEIGQVSMFDASDRAPHVTKDGHTYVPILFFKPDSRLLIVQYELDLCTRDQHNQCRQRYFVFEDGRFHSVSETLSSCTRQGEEPE